MDQRAPKAISQFFAAGISYKKTDADVRSLFAVGEEACGRLLKQARQQGCPELFVLSTCNRTEIYGFAQDPSQLIGLLCSESKGDPELFRQLAYVHQGKEAVRHLYRVAAGLDSQILGDYEVISQVKNAAKFAKKQGTLGMFTERLVNSVLQVSKVIKNETALSSGTVSVAFAAVQYLKAIPGIADKRILLVGMGKIGCNACRNIVDYLGARNIVLMNRTRESADRFAASYGLTVAPFGELPEQLQAAEVILVATNAPAPVVQKAHFEGAPGHPRIILDLSIPRNVEAGVEALPAIQVINVDDLSRVQDETLRQREQEIPRALGIIEEQMQDFLYWYQMRKHAVLLQAVKQKMEEIHHREIRLRKGAEPGSAADMEEMSSRIVQKMVNLFAGKLRKANGKAEDYLQLLGEIFEIPVNE